MRCVFTPRYTITAPILSAIAVIENARGHVDAARILPEAQLALRRQSTVESVNSSTRIEGNPLVRSQVEDALADRQINATGHAVAEVRNYARAWEWVRTRQLSLEPLAVPDVLHLHALTIGALLPAEKAGRFRTGLVWVVDSVDGRDEIRYTAPEADHVPALLDDLMSWLATDEVHPLIAAGVGHAYLAAIHPFTDGNGRVARLLARLVLGRAGYGFRDALVLEDFYAADRGAYYAAIDLGPTYQDRAGADATDWLVYFLRGFVTSVARLAEQVAVLSAAGTPATRIRVTADQAALLEYAVREGSLSLADAVGVLPGVSRRTVQRALRALVDTGLVRAVGSARATRYVPRSGQGARSPGSSGESSNADADAHADQDGDEEGQH